MYRLMKQTEELIRTFQVWSNISPTLEQLMQDIKAKRLERELKEMCQDRLKILDDILREFSVTKPRGYIALRGVDIVLKEPFRTIIETLPVEQGAPKEHFAKNLNCTGSTT